MLHARALLLVTYNLDCGVSKIARIASTFTLIIVAVDGVVWTTTEIRNFAVCRGFMLNLGIAVSMIKTSGLSIPSILGRYVTSTVTSDISANFATNSYMNSAVKTAGTAVGRWPVYTLG